MQLKTKLLSVRIRMANAVITFVGAALSVFLSSAVFVAAVPPKVGILVQRDVKPTVTRKVSSGR